MPCARQTTCAGCGGLFSIGWGILNHTRNSPCTPVSAGAAAAEDAQIEIPQVVSTVHDYMESLAERGTLAPAFLHTYGKWGPRPVSRIVTEACRFLRTTEVGCGSSRRHGQTFLDYAKSLGGRAHLLPKTVEGCWKLVEKVSGMAHSVTNT
jgi:hypothetical protein